MPPRTRVNPKDFTGQQKAKLQAEHAEELAQRKDEIAMMHAAEIEALDVPVELDGSGNERQLTAEDLKPVELAPNWVEIRTNCDIEKATIGYGTEYNFKEGQVYRVSHEVANWLGYLGYLR